jgi:hypothetical protein
MRNLRRIIHWCLYVLPPPHYCLTIFILVGAFEFTVFHFIKPLKIPDLDSGMMFIRLEFSGFLCCAYGIFRAAKFHPWFQRPYSQWLASTPWSWWKPLPLGPIHLIAQDAVFLGLVYLYLFSSPYALPGVVLSFLVPYLTILGFSFFCTGVWPFGYALAFGLGAVVLLAEKLDAASWAILGCYGIAFFGIRAMLSKFPWENQWQSSQTALQYSSGKKQPYDRSLGWHFERLAPLAKILSIPRRHRLLFPLLAGWVCFAVAIHAHNGDSRRNCLTVFYLIPCVVSFLARVGVYCAYYRNPLGLFGRIFPGPPIVPRYDKVFLVPLGLVLFAVAAPLVLTYLHVNFALLLAVSLTLVLSLAMNGKPTLKHWALTGGHRIAAIPQKAARLR